MDRRVALTAVAGALAAVLLSAVATSGPVQLVEGPPTVDWNLELRWPELTPPNSPGDDAEFLDADRPPSTFAKVSTAVIQYMLLAALAALTVYAVRYLWQNRPRLVWRRTRRPDDFDVLDDVAASIMSAAAEQRAALGRGDARNSIVECWMRLELLVASVGFQRDSADTAAEFTTRVLSSYRIDPDAIFDLSSLYREARFSTHRMCEAERAAAIAALDAIHDGLWRHRETVSAP